MIENKFKFYSPVHRNYKLQWIYLGIFTTLPMLLFIDPLSTLELFSLFLVLKIMDWFEIMVKIRNSKSYINWIDDLKSFEYIIYSKYLFVVTIIYIFISEFYITFNSESILTIILSVIYIVILIILSSTFYKNVLKLKK